MGGDRWDSAIGHRWLLRNTLYTHHLEIPIYGATHFPKYAKIEQKKILVGDEIPSGRSLEYGKHSSNK